MKAPHPLAELLPSLLHDEYRAQFALLSAWQDMFGAADDLFYLERVTGETAVIGVYDACWLQELSAFSSIFLDTIQKTLDTTSIKRVHLKRAGTRPRKKPISSYTKRPPSTMCVTPTQQERAALDALLDQDLASALQSFLMRCYQEREAYGYTESGMRGDTATGK